MHLNIEIKAHCDNPDAIRQYLLNNGAVFKGTDNQKDTYFEVPEGRLKLRQGNIENALIHYHRTDSAGPKDSKVTMAAVANGDEMLQVLSTALPVIVVVDKRREIYFIENVKFHIDEVVDLGSFMEIEAIDFDGSIGRDKLVQQCEYYIGELGITKAQMVKISYSDLLLADL